MFVIERDPGSLCILLVLFCGTPDIVCSAFRFLEVAVDDIDDLRDADRDVIGLLAAGEVCVFLMEDSIIKGSVCGALTGSACDTVYGSPFTEHVIWSFTRWTFPVVLWSSVIRTSSEEVEASMLFDASRSVMMILKPSFSLWCLQ